MVFPYKCWLFLNLYTLTRSIMSYKAGHHIALIHTVCSTAKGLFPLIAHSLGYTIVPFLLATPPLESERAHSGLFHFTFIFYVLLNVLADFLSGIFLRWDITFRISWIKWDEIYYKFFISKKGRFFIIYNFYLIGIALFIISDIECTSIIVFELLLVLRGGPEIHSFCLSC